MADLAEFRTAVRRMVGDAHDDAAAFDNDLIDAGLRDGLRMFGIHGPARESSLTVTAEGYELDVSSLGASKVWSVAWPWWDGADLATLSRPFRMVDGETVRLGRCALSVGEVVRVRYDLVHTIEDLDGATVTTILASEEPAFLYAVGSGVLTVRARRLDAIPSAPKGEADRLRALAVQWFDRFQGMLTHPGAIS